MFLKSIRFRAFLWYMVILTVTLLSFSLIIYGGLHKALYDAFDDLLSSRAEGVVNSIDTYWQTHNIHFQDRPDDGIDREKAKKNFINMARGWVEEQRKDPELMNISVQILNAKGEKLVSSRLMPQIMALDEEDLEDLAEGEEDFDTVKGQTVDGKKARFRVYSRPVTEGEKVAYIVQVTGPVYLLSVALGKLRFILFGLLPLAILLAGMPGVLLIRMTLRPVDKMVNILRQITAKNLKVKIHIPDTRDELVLLAETFNEMIDRLNRSFSSQQRFIQNISNELKTPMSILKTELEDALAKDCPQDQLKSVVSRASEEIEEFSKVIDNLLTVSDFEDNKLALDIRRVNLTRLAEKAANDMKMISGKKDIEMSFVCSDTIVLDGDEIQLRQLFLNLLDNAIKYTNRNGRITVTVSLDGSSAKIDISDTGVGIPQDEMDYIFDRFYQATNARAAHRGFGLGLSVVKSIVEEHKGIVSVTSEVGKGSTFTVRLPLSYPG